MEAWALGGALALAGTLGAGQAGAASSPPFVDNGDGTVSDTSTGLMWDQCADGLSGNGSCNAGTAARYYWANALRRAGAQSAANYKGYPDWRLPTIVELRTLDKVDSSNPAIDGIAFPNTPADGFWSGSLYAPSPASGVWVVYFQDGGAFFSFKSNSNYVRLVRSGQSFDSFVGVFPIGISGVTASAATLSATSSSAATGYWLVVPRDATPPSSAQVIAGASYGAVTVAASGSGAMVAKTPASFAVSGLTVGTAYDLYLMAKEGTYQTTSNTAGPIPFSTADISTSSIVIDPSTPSTLYAALDGAGVYASTDSSATWSAINTGLSNLNVRALAVQNSSTLFAATYDGGVFKGSLSAGNLSWATCGSGLGATVRLRSLLVDSTGNLYAGSETGVFKGSTACAAWTAQNNGMP